MNCRRFRQARGPGLGSPVSVSHRVAHVVKRRAVAIFRGFFQAKALFITVETAGLGDIEGASSAHQSTWSVGLVLGRQIAPPWCLIARAVLLGGR